MKPFEARTVPRPNFVLRLARRKPTKGAPIEINNTLAAATSIRDVHPDHISEIAERYAVDITSRFSTDLKDLYRAYLHHCLADKRLTKDEVQDLAHLKGLFTLSDHDITEIHEELAGKVFGKSVADTLADGRLSPVERAFLENLQAELKLPDEIATRLLREASQARLQEHLDDAVEDERLSPQEEQELRAIADSLGAEFTMSESTRKLYERFRTYWAIENADLPEVQTDINLQRGETCWAVRSVGWFEPRTVTKRMRYAGPTARIRIAKGIYLRAGDIAFQPIKEEVLTPIDRGELYVTNKRIIFVGTKKNTNIRLNRILDFKPFGNGVELVKDAGRNPFFEFDSDVDLFTLILARALKDS